MSSPSPSPNDPCRLVLAAAAGIALGLLGPSEASAAGDLPARLSQTGLYVDGSTTQVRPGLVAFTPAHALWSDGADKQRGLRLPAGHAIDARRADAWEFPRGTLLWKQFSHAGRPVETRTIERLADGRWRFASCVWREDGSDADLAPAQGAVVPVAAAPGGRYSVPSRSDCLACHGSTTVPVLGPRRPDAGAVRAGAPGQPAGILHSLLARTTRAGAPAVFPGNAQASALWQRMATHRTQTRMPPLGAEIPDADGLALVGRWIDQDLQRPQQKPR